MYDSYICTGETRVWLNRAIPAHRDLIEVGPDLGNPLVRIGSIGDRAAVIFHVRTMVHAQRLADVLRDIVCPLEASNV